MVHQNVSLELVSLVNQAGFPNCDLGVIKINDLLRILFHTHSEYWCQVIVCDDYALQMDVFWLFNVIWKICTALMLKTHNMLSWHKGIVEIEPDQKAREDVSHAEPVIDMEFTNTAPHTIILTFCCILSVSGCPSTWGMSLFLGEINSGGKVVFSGIFSLCRLKV